MTDPATLPDRSSGRSTPLFPVEIGVATFAVVSIAYVTLGGAVVAAVGLAVPSEVAAPGDLLAASLVAIAALSLPHVVVAWLDRQQGVWRPGSVE